jgi:hypothetical protein
MILSAVQTYRGDDFFFRAGRPVTTALPGRNDKVGVSSSASSESASLLAVKGKPWGRLALDCRSGCAFQMVSQLLIIEFSP